jgi:hypothetical protein
MPTVLAIGNSLSGHQSLSRVLLCMLFCMHSFICVDYNTGHVQSVYMRTVPRKPLNMAGEIIKDLTLETPSTSSPTKIPSP